MPTTIASYNVNGIRAAIKKGLLEWIAENKYDIICFQETKAQADQVDPKPFEELGYALNWHSAEKKGYSGVATFSKIKTTAVHIGCGIEKYDREGRILRTDFGDLTVLNCYFPSGSSGEVRHKFKMEFLEDLGPWFKELSQKRPKLIILGDYNIVHQGMDIHNPKRKDNPSGYRPEERAWLDNYFNNGFTDAFRFSNPEKIEFSWWSYRSGARKNNKGWRIDYQAASLQLKTSIKKAFHDQEAKHSDHCPVVVSYDL
jgi:exodeoxyribonuclease-3